MVAALSPMGSMCRARAREARRGADVATTRQLRGFWHEMERRWLILARGYEMSQVMHAIASKRRNGTLH